jgi:hypothetical protein
MTLKYDDIKNLTIGEVIDLTIKEESKQTKNKTIDDIVNALINWQRDHRGYVEQCRGITAAINIAEELRE